MRIHIAPLVTTLLVTTTAIAQGAWLKQSPALSPPARAMGGLAAMTQQSKCVLFGGEIAEPAASLNDTWIWDGTSWTQQMVTGPAPLEGFVMEYDIARDKVVLFSGWNGNVYVAQTWEFDGTSWTMTAPAVHPPGRDWSGGAYDAARSNLVIFGGHDWQAAGGTVGDTWTWDGTNWTSHAVTGPSARWGHAMAFDPVRNTVILFGGTGVGDDMWEWNGTAWSQITPATVPPPRKWHRMVTDPARSRVVMIGGHWGTSAVNDIWEWDGTDWQQLTTVGTPPSAWFLQGATLDPVSGQILQFGGSVVPDPARTLSSDETKLLAANGTGWAVEQEYGAGCGAKFDYASYYEQFGGGAFDLGGAVGTETVLSNTFIASGYLVLPGASAWYTPTSPDLALGDDQVSAAQPLGFTLTLPGAVQTTDIYICSNGYIWLTAPGTADYTPTVAEFLGQGERLAPYWTDLRPAAGGGAGTIHFDTDPANGMAYVTFVGVREWSSSSNGFIDMQVAISATGNIDYRYGVETMSTGGTQSAIVGLTPGNGALDPGSTDLSNIGTVPLITAPDLFRPDLALGSTRPVIGTTTDLTIGNIPSGSILGAQIYGLTKHDPGISLASFGMPGCFQYCSQDSVRLIISPSGSSVTSPFTIPNVAVLAGVSVKAQGAIYDPAGSHNPLGALSSNGLELLLDAN